MPTKRRIARPELLIRSVELSDVVARISIRVDHPRGQEPEVEGGPWLELRGILDEAVNDVREVLISTFPEDEPSIGPARPAGIGSVIGMKPTMSIVVSWSHRDFDRLWALALAGRLSFANLCFTKPRYGKARVVNASFSSEREE